MRWGACPVFVPAFWNHDPKEWDNTGGISNDGIWQFDAYSDLKELFGVTLGTPDYDFFQTSVIDFPSGSSSSTLYNPFGNIDGVDSGGSALSLHVDVGNDSIMAVWTGHLNVDSQDAGETTFYTASDDGSVIYIDKNRVVWNQRIPGSD